MSRALVFDYDGLIIDTETPEYESWRRVYAEHGQELTVESWTQVVGGVEDLRFDLQLERRLGRSLDWGTIHPRRKTHHGEMMAGQGILPGVEALMRLASQSGWKIGVASSSSSQWVRGGLERLGLIRYVQALRTRDTVTRYKPHPEPYLKVLEDLDALPQVSFAFEDSATGVAAAKAAGLRVVAVPNALTRLHDLSAADLVLASLEAFQLPLGE